MATLIMRATDGASADKKRRARKGKNAQKKQPQRGLGVAQLEKLRLQEQSHLCPPSPSYSLRLSSTSTEHSMSRCDSDVSQTVLSLTNGPAGSSLRDNRGVSFYTLSGHSSSQTLSTHGKCNVNNEPVDAKRVACINQPSKSGANVPFFSSVLTSTPHEAFESQGHGHGHDEDERRLGSGGDIPNTPVYMCPAIHNLKEAATPVNVESAGYKFHPVFKDVSRIPITIAEPHYNIESRLGSDVTHVPRKRIELPVVGVSPNADKPKELPSFQSHPSKTAWSSPDKSSGTKRRWVTIQETGRLVSQAQALDLNAPAGESEISNEDHHKSLFTQQELVSENRVGAHYTTGTIQSALGNSCLPLVKLKPSSSAPPWRDSESSSSASGCFPDMALYSENGLLFKQCASPSIAKDSCSSATGPTSYFTLNRHRSLNEAETPSPVGKESICSINFLTLGMSSSFYSGGADGGHEREESTQDTMMSKNIDVKRLKQGYSSGCDGEEGSQIRPPIQKELGTVDLVGHTSLRNCSTLHIENVLSPVPAISNFAGKRQLTSSRIEDDDDTLDLRLKLAL